MAEPELRLNLMKELGDDRWIYQTLVFDMTMLRDPFVRPWTIQGIETGIQAAASSRAVNDELLSLLALGRHRTIRFYSDGPSFVAGLRPAASDAVNFGMAGASGVSTWSNRFGDEGISGPVPTPPGARTDLRMYLNPTGGTGMSLPGTDGSYHPTYSYLVGTL